MNTHDDKPMVRSGVQTQLSDAVAEILARVDADIAARRPVCKSSGNCCKFEHYGHRLYVTAVELAHFAHVHVSTQSPPSPQSKIQNQNSKIDSPKSLSLQQFFAQSTPTGCPYQINNLCTAREARPLGCRIYFCDENAQSWQNDLYEKYHRELTALHDQHRLPYRYLEWRAALRELLQSPASPQRCAP